MNSLHQRPQPLYAAAPRPCCPVCGHASYSPAGIHPQCAMRAADQLQRNRLKAQNLSQAKPASTGRYEKPCPQCRRIHPIRQQSCECGHSFLYKSQQTPAG